MQSKAIAVFCRYPEIGYVKTRLAKVIGKTSALKVYTKLLKNTISQVNSLINSNIDINIFYFIDRFEKKEDFEFFLKHYNGIEFSSDKERSKIEIQYGKDIGERMANTFDKLFNLGYNQVLIIGTDIVGDLLKELEDAFSHFKMSDIVLGPSHDGGFYLIGCKNRFDNYIFRNIEWSTQNVLKKLVLNIEAKGYKYSLTNKLYDIDNYEDLKKALSDNLITYDGELYA